MKFSRNFKSLFAMLFSGIYLFAFLFAANIHEHDAGYFYKDLNFKNSSAKFSKESKVNNSDDCLSCHFAAAPVLLPESFKIQFSEFNFNEVQFSFGQFQLTRSPHFNFFLRGPPVFI